jgi:hypothetical protein
MGAFHGILPHVANIDNQSATVFVAMQQHSHSNAYVQHTYRFIIAMIRLSKEHVTENGVF